LAAGAARLLGDPHRLDPAGRQPRGLSDDLGHDLLRRAVSIVLDDAPECVGHFSTLPRWPWRLRAGRGRALSPRWARRPGGCVPAGAPAAPPGRPPRAGAAPRAAP